MFVLIQQKLIRATKHDMYANEYSAYRLNENVSCSLQCHDSRFADLTAKTNMASKASVTGL